MLRSDASLGQSQRRKVEVASLRARMPPARDDERDMRNIMLVVMCLTGCNAQTEVGQQTWECPLELEPSSLGVENAAGPVQFGSVTGAIAERAAAGRPV